MEDKNNIFKPKILMFSHSVLSVWLLKAERKKLIIEINNINIFLGKINKFLTIK